LFSKKEALVPSRLSNRAGSRHQVFLKTTIPSKLAEMGFTSEPHAGETHFFQPIYPSL